MHDRKRNRFPSHRSEKSTYCCFRESGYHSETPPQFWEYANNNQSGSVNHFINWSTFSAYEFDLPSLEEQRELSEIVWAMVDAQRAYKALIAASDELVKSQFVEMFINTCEYPTVHLNEVSMVTSGLTKNPNRPTFHRKMTSSIILKTT